MARVIVWVAIALTPIVLVADYVFDVAGTASFALSAGALAPLAFVIGEATENIAEHTGAGIGGFLMQTGMVIGATLTFLVASATPPSRAARS